MLFGYSVRPVSLAGTRWRAWPMVARGAGNTSTLGGRARQSRRPRHLHHGGGRGASDVHTFDNNWGSTLKAVPGEAVERQREGASEAPCGPGTAVCRRGPSRNGRIPRAKREADGVKRRGSAQRPRWQGDWRRRVDNQSMGQDCGGPVIIGKARPSHHLRPSPPPPRHPSWQRRGGRRRP